MCGIFGLYNINKDKKVNEALVKEATDTMIHRGPDDSGIFVQDNLGLGHRRLSIIDLSGGHQPMFNEDRKIALVYNGEIYNYQQIREELLAKGHIFRTNCDTEVIIHAYEEWGFKSVERYIGMFAFCLFDGRDDSLWIVRDRLGIKPLYYCFDGQTFTCASEIKPLLKSGVKAELNEKVIDAYLSLGYVPAPETMFKGIMKLRQGHFLKLSRGKLKEEEYWDFANVEKQEIPFKQALVQFKELLYDSVNKRLLSDVPLGVFLSGGIDSSAVTALMASMIKEPVNSFTVSYDAKYGVGEEEYADQVAKQYKTAHNVFRLAPENFFESLEHLVEYAEEPIVEPAAIALYHISRMARNKAIVLLSGEGSDEILAGYRLYDFMRKIDGMSKFIPGFLAKIPFNLKYKHRKYLDWVTSPLEKRYQGTSSYLTDSLKAEFYSKIYYDTKSDYLVETFARHFDKVAGRDDILDKMLYVDTKTWLADDLLVKADKMTMAASIELRVPFLDHRLVEFAFSLPSEFKLNNGQGKWLLKEAMRDMLPDSIIDREKKGFPVPVKQWFGQELLGEVKNILEEAKLSWISGKAINRMISDQQNGKEDHSKMIMSMLVLAKWKARYLA